MKGATWSAVKNIELSIKHGITFDEIIRYEKIGLIQHPSRSNQFIVLYEIHGYVWAVPCVKNNKSWFLKTLYPTRKYTRIYKKGKLHEKNKTI